MHDLLKNGCKVNKLARALKKLSDANTVDDDQQTPLHVACAAGMLDHIALLLRKGADINARDMNGWTPLHFCSRENNLDACRLLLSQQSIDVTLTTKEQNSVLHYLVRKSVHADVVPALRGVLDMLIEKGINIDAQNKIGETPLHSACMAVRGLSLSRSLGACRGGVVSWWFVV